MKKRISAALLALVMALSLLPTAALAAEGDAPEAGKATATITAYEWEQIDGKDVFMKEGTEIELFVKHPGKTQADSGLIGSAKTDANGVATFTIEYDTTTGVIKTLTHEGEFKITDSNLRFDCGPKEKKSNNPATGQPEELYGWNYFTTGRIRNFIKGDHTHSTSQSFNTTWGPGSWDDAEIDADYQNDTWKTEGFSFVFDVFFDQTADYTVKFDLDGGKINGSATVAEQTVKRGAYVEIPGVPTKEHQRFTGWYVGETKWEVETATDGKLYTKNNVTKDITLKATWEDDITYKVEYVWGTEYPSDVTLPSDSTVYLTEKAARDGYASTDTTMTTTSTKNGTKVGSWTFVGWNDGVLTDGADEWHKVVKYTGSWTFVENTYTVKYDVNGGVTTSTQTEWTDLKYGDTTPTIAEPTKAADDTYTYKFAGWDPAVAETVTDNATYTAKWENAPVTYKVAYDWGTAPSGKTLPIDTTVYATEDEAKAAVDTTFVKSDNVFGAGKVWIFSGWSYENTTTAADGNKVVNFTGTWTEKNSFSPILAPTKTAKVNIKVLDWKTGEPLCGVPVTLYAKQDGKAGRVDLASVFYGQSEEGVVYTPASNSDGMVEYEIVFNANGQIVDTNGALAEVYTFDENTLFDCDPVQPDPDDVMISAFNYNYSKVDADEDSHEGSEDEHYHVRFFESGTNAVEKHIQSAMDTHPEFNGAYWDDAKLTDDWKTDGFEFTFVIYLDGDAWTVDYNWGENAPKSAKLPDDDTLYASLDAALFSMSDDSYGGRYPDGDYVLDDDGWKFSGWGYEWGYTEPEEGEEAEPIERVIHFTGTWTKMVAPGPLQPIPTYTIKYDANGGKGSMADQKQLAVEGADPVTIKANEFTRSGYTFKYWTTEANGSGTVYTPGMPVTFTADTTLWAQWKKNYTPTYERDDDDDDNDLKLNTEDHFAYIQGYDDGTVRPRANVTRGAVSAILYRIMDTKCVKKYQTTVNSFSDVDEDTWCNLYVSTLENAGVIVDTAPGGAFRPYDAITRAELVTMLAQFATATKNDEFTFSDVDTDHWAVKEIQIAAEMGWTKGYEDGSFHPESPITRAELVTMINRALNRVPASTKNLLSAKKMITFTDCTTDDWFYIAIQEAANSHEYTRVDTKKDPANEKWSSLLKTNVK